ncbi:arginyltransferase [Stieleria sp. TO1_6]|uniref:arginyltransferase n=1 Tax=Stieleria tagensis TaxID=2956795 RepID=UPI00209B34DF|nr:arginyltransferase [Stieleria tagensis]MCO8121939.1 arginyltransferase [Stieleria tagensis]
MDQEPTSSSNLHRRDQSAGHRPVAGGPSSPGQTTENRFPELVVVYDGYQECPYLDGNVARMPLEYPRRTLQPTDLDRLLALGYRRSGAMFYRTRCPSCQECVPTRVDVQQFQWTRSLKRILNRSDRELQLTWGRPTVDPQRLELFNAHRNERALSRSGPANLDDYREFLVTTSVETAELSFHLQGQLIGIAVADLGQTSINAVYTHFAPQFGRYSIGTLAVLKQIQQAQQTGRNHVYLGLYVAANPHLNYKQRFCPQQRLVNGIWQTHSDPSGLIVPAAAD